MSRRLAQGGRLIDRSAPLAFTFNGDRKQGLRGDTLASALLAENQVLMGRSFKYHRPRGVVTNGGEEPNALMGLGEGKTYEPNARATQTELVAGMKAESQNHWPSLEYDVGEINAKLSKFLPAGFYYKMFMWPRAFWKHVYEPVIRASAGLGKPPKARDADTYEHMYAHVDLLVVGGGIAGLSAALAAARAGREVMLVEQSPHWGGRVMDAGEIDDVAATDWVARTVEELAGYENVSLRLRAMASGLYDHAWATVLERVDDHGNHDLPRHRLWKIRAGAIVTATGAIERPLPFANNDRPGVMLASAMRDYVTDYGVLPSDRTVIVTNNDDAYRTALTLHGVGAEVAAVLDVRAEPGPLADRAREAGIRVLTESAVAKVEGRGRVEKVVVCHADGQGTAIEEIGCDGVAMSGGWSPVVHLWSHAGGKLGWDEDQAMFRPDATRAPTGDEGQRVVWAAGAANGAISTAEVLADAAAQIADVLGSDPASIAEAVVEDAAPIKPVWTMPTRAPYDLRSKAFLDFQNDVKVTDVELAHREGFRSVEHAKRYTTLGMATDQGKLSNINGLAILAAERGDPIPSVGTTTFRPPFTPITMGSIAGEARGDMFQPVRHTALHERHEAHGAHWEPVGHWRRPYAFPGRGGDLRAAVNREIMAVRECVGMLDASTLGKILVKGPDAGKFLDMMYTNMMSTLPVGRCRYGLMCSENGFLIDDGVVARLSDDEWLCHTTTGGADRIHAHMEEWLQTEWWDWKVYVANLTEHYGQIAVAGPKARDVLAGLTEIDISKEALPFMTWTDTRVAGHPARIFRISFSGELSYEIAVPASVVGEVWDAIAEAGEPYGIRPYGTEALHVLRAEKGFIMIGDETDGTVIPQDLGLNWAISKKKDDYLGKRAQERDHMTDPNRWKLVGLETLDGSVLPEGAYAATDQKNDNGQRVVEGRVTSTYYSPTLDRGIAMGLVLHGPDRMGEVLDFPDLGGAPIKAKIVSPVFYDPQGEKNDV